MEIIHARIKIQILFILTKCLEALLTAASTGPTQQYFIHLPLFKLKDTFTYWILVVKLNWSTQRYNVLKVQFPPVPSQKRK